MFNDLLILLALLIILVELYRKVRQIWLRILLSQKKKEEAEREAPHPWRLKSGSIRLASSG